MITKEAYGGFIVDEAGNEWVDAVSGILNVSLGHGHEIVHDAIRSIGYVNSYASRSAAEVDLCAELAKHMPGGFPVWRLTNTGAEAIERAIQCVATLLGRPAHIGVLPGSFHGKSLALSPLCYPATEGWRKSPWGHHVHIQTIFDLEEDDYDALLWEPVQGWQGARYPEARVREACDNKGAFLIADEMITGFLRCGDMLLSRTADFVVTGKGLAQGLPLAAIGLKSDIQLPIKWTTTAGGNHLCSSVGMAVFDYLMANETSLRRNVAVLHDQLTELGFNAIGALGFCKTHHPAKVREVFDRHRILANWNGDAIRIGPHFAFESRAMRRLQLAMEEVKPWL